MQEYLEQKIHEYQRSHYGKMPAFIVMHPSMWEKLTASIYPSTTINMVDLTDIRYKGIPVFRSLDCDEQNIHV